MLSKSLNTCQYSQRLPFENIGNYYLVFSGIVKKF